MPTQADLDNAAIDALALTSFMTQPAGTTTLNSAGSDIGTLADVSFGGASKSFANIGALRASTDSIAVGEQVSVLKEGTLLTVVDAAAEAHLVTASGVRLVHPDGPYLIVITGQSNAAGANDDGPNPASDLVKVWDGVTADWGSSDRTALPLTRNNPHGNQGNNNYGLARAHRVADDTGRPVFVVFDAQGGQPLSEWVGLGTASPRYTSLTTKVVAALASAPFSASAKTNVDEIIVAQGEADFNDDFATYLDKVTKLRNQFRAEPWFDNASPMFMMSPSDLHDRYQWRDAMAHLCSQRDNRCFLVSGNGLRTEYSVTGSGDHTHFLGESLWEAGYNRIADTAQLEGSPTFFYGRGTGPADGTDETAMATFRTLVSRDSWTTTVPPNGPAATGSISWGHECRAEGNYSYALGYQSVTDNLSNYGLLAGRAMTTGSSADYFGGFGYQITLEARYTFAAGRGHVVADQGATAFGLFTEYATAQTDPAILQIGNGTSTSARSNALTVRKSGQIEMKDLPVHVDAAAATTAGLTAGSVYATPAGDLKIVV